MTILRILLYPFALIFDVITRVRNYLYDIGQKPSFSFEVPVLSVGNLNVGGSGKTPMVEYLIRLLQSGGRIATLSRGYGRTTRGVRFASDEESATTIGDEPFQLYRKFGSRVLITVGEDRAFAIPHILHQQPETKTVILDDAFQHRPVKPHLSILLTDFARPFYADWILPTGMLRESRHGAGRADIIVVTRCPKELEETSMKHVTGSIARYAPGKPVFFAALSYGEVAAFGNSAKVSDHVVIISGLANAKPFEEYIRSKYTVVRHFEFRDHHRYTAREIRSIAEYCKNGAKPVSLVTTEKDMVRLLDVGLRPLIEMMPWFYVPVEMRFVKNGPEFDELVLQTIAQSPKSIENQ